MKIKTKFYYLDKGKYFEYGGQLVLDGKQIKKLGKLPIEEAGRSFYFDDTHFEITCEKENKRFKRVINRIITESSYKTSQREYLARLTWLQQQKLLWMFKRHWLQQPGNIVHLFITILIISVAFVSFKFVLNSY